MKAVLFNPFLILFGLFPFFTQAQYITVSGYVTNFLTGKAIENVNVFESHSGIGTITDKNGFFKLILKKSDMNISFAQNGFKSILQNYYGSKDTTLNIQMEPLKWMNLSDKPELHTKADEAQKESQQRKKFIFF